MAALSGTQTNYDIRGQREDLADVIYRISPEETPFMSGAGRGPKANATFVEWQTDALAAPDTANARVEGNDAAFAVPAATVRVGNYTQISDKTLMISGSAEATDKAGRRSEMALQAAKRGAELKRDMEAMFLANQPAVAGSTSVARRFAALPAWLKTNINKASDGVNPTYTSGAPLAARTDGTQRAFTEVILKDVIQQGYTNGASFNVLMVGPVNKVKVSAFSGIAQHTTDTVGAKPTVIIAAVDVYVSDFGNFRVVPNRFQRERDAWLLDFDQVSVSYLRPFKTEPLAKTGDAEKRLLVGEYTLRVNQEAGLGLAADLLTT